MICGMTYYQICWYFLIYSFGGWALEVVYHAVACGKVINRGFLNGPVCPVYGFGVLSVFAMMNTFQGSGYQLSDGMIFLFGVILATAVELIAGWLLDVCFHARWWDYSKRKFNINGRICLETLLPFGIMGCLILYIVNPAFLNIYEKMPNIALHIICGILLAVYITDNIISGKIISNLKEISVSVKDNTEEISKKVKKIITQKSGLHRRLVEAFPNIKAKVNLKDWITKGEEKINELKNRE